MLVRCDEPELVAVVPSTSRLTDGWAWPVRPVAYSSAPAAPAVSRRLEPRAADDGWPPVPVRRPYVDAYDARCRAWLDGLRALGDYDAVRGDGGRADARSTMSDISEDVPASTCRGLTADQDGHRARGLEAIRERIARQRHSPFPARGTDVFARLEVIFNRMEDLTKR